MAQFCIKTLYLGPKQYLVHRIPHCTATAAGVSGVKSVLCIRIPILHGWLLAGVGQTLYPVSCICILHFYVEVGVGPTLHPVFRICIPYLEQRRGWGKLRIPYSVSVSRICMVWVPFSILYLAFESCIWTLFCVWG